MTNIFPASLDKLYEMLNIVRQFAHAAGFDEREVSMIELAVEEALVNIISYGYPDRAGSITIESQKTEPNGIRLIIQDKGVAYNPLTNSKHFDESASLESRTVGGYGIFFILKIMDEVDYRRENNCNILTLVKYLQ